ncbi:MAG: lysine--tRNA ligase, partial [Mycobacterium sp.]
MTLTASRPRSRSTSRLRWVPAAAGWTVGVIATLSLIASVSPVIRWVIKMPREFINDYLFNFPDTSFAWSFVLALLAGALTARKRIAWWLLVLNLLLAAGLNIAGLTADDVTPLKRLGETLGLGFHLAALLVLVLAYREFWAKVRSGALFKAAGVLLTGWAIGILLSWSLVEAFPRTLARDDRFLYVVNRVIGFA